MSRFTLLATLVSAAVVNASLEEQCVQLFADFKAKHLIKYADDNEDSYRQDVFCASMKRADEKNALNGRVSFGVTKFSDRTVDEFSVLLGRKNNEVKPKRERDVKKPLKMKDSTYVNWVEEGVVTTVKNQGQCGSCWAFSAAEQIESQWAMAGNPLWEFSPQQIASCTTTVNGCGGGDTVAAYEYLESTVGLGSAWFAPYVQSMYASCNGASCTQSCSLINVSALPTEAFYTGPYAQVTGYSYATTPCAGPSKCANQDTALLAQNIAEYGPASVCVNAGSWNDYTGGVMSQAACGGYASWSLDHCVQAVGFNATADTPYWIIKNTWATNWGENGYIFLEYPANSCGLANEATFVTIGNSQAQFEA